MRLSELKTGEKGVVVKVLGHGGFRKRIVEMGFIKGKKVQVILNAPLKDPIKYKILGYEISLRRQEAEMIEIISEEEAMKEIKEESLTGITEEIPIPDEELKALALNKRRTINVALVGNPNCGKTSLFNAASGGHEHVGNYSGVTVDAKEGFFDFQGYHFRIIDLPGTYSLSTYSPEELYVRKYIIDQTPDVIINVVDASNLERNLYLTTQLIDMNVRMVIALNMYDDLEASGNKLKYQELGKMFGVPMVPTVSRLNRGIDHLFHLIINIYEGSDFLNDRREINPEVLKELQDWHKKNVPEEHDCHQADFTNEYSTVTKKKKERHSYRHIHINHGTELERSIDEVKDEICKNESIRHKYSTRFLAIKLLENDKDIEQHVINALPNASSIIATRNKEQERIFNILGEESESAITDAKYGYISGALKETYTENDKATPQFTRVLDLIITHRVWGYPIFFLFLYIMFQGTFVLGNYPMEAIEWLVEQNGNIIQNNMAPGVIKDMLTAVIVGGIGGVIVFLPNILLLYFFISIMEDSGYMARAAFIMDKIMHRMGLHGKSFIPLIMGFGCNVPAVLATRTIENRKSRLITMLIVPLMSCSARLPLYLVLAGAFFPNQASLVLLGIYATGILLAVLMARIFSKLFMKGDDTPFVMELPPYRMPSMKTIIRHTWEKGEQYLKKIGGVILAASIVIWFLGYFPNHDAYSSQAEQQENSYIGMIGKAIEPALAPLGFDWKMSIGLISGAGAKEMVVSTLGVLYADETDVDSISLAERLPITPLVALCYMLFVLIYFPCLATLGAIKQETGKWRWAIFVAVYTTLLAWFISFAVYRIGLLFF